MVCYKTEIRQFKDGSKSDITKTCLYNFDPLKPHFYIVKLGFKGVYIISLISAQKHWLWELLEPPHQGGSNESPQSTFWAEIWKISEFLSENFHFLVVKFSVYLNRHLFVMPSPNKNAPIIFLYILNIILWIQHSYLANKVFPLDPSNSFMKRLWCTYNKFFSFIKGKLAKK